LVTTMKNIIYKEVLTTWTRQRQFDHLKWWLL
jgi:hypothetical protein